ncbi:MAG TPA: protein-L-isoaspartate(D-aspartate) O-methyltransferase [Terriglobales bacterium]|jgi:protein-L-isoaspartate(D-aspartate) O-methyltransferase
MSQSEISDRDSYADQRFSMVENQLRRRGIDDERVLNAMLRVPRHEFVPEAHRAQAYEDHPIPIGEEQTISQPFIVAASLKALALKGSESVLEVGTGSGYQTALLALLAKNVYSVERHASLAHAAERAMIRLGFANVQIAVGDGSQGWREHAPYDAVLVSAAAPSIPQSLLDQLSDFGEMVIPVGPAHSQQLQLIRKFDGWYEIEILEGCRFVPLVGAEGY